MRRVVADTNVLVSAIEFGGKPKQLLDLAIDGHIVLAISEPILDETRRVMRDKFDRSVPHTDATPNALGLEAAPSSIRYRAV